MKINLDSYYEEQKPTIVVFGKEYEVVNDYKKVLAFFKKKEQIQDTEESIKEFISFALVDGDKAASEILSNNFGFEFFQKIILGISACMTGQTIEQLEAQKDAGFRK